MKPRILSVARLSFPLATALAALFNLAAPSNLQAAIVFWDGAGGNVNWSTLNNWGTSGANITSNPTAIPGSTDDVVFYSTGATQLITNIINQAFVLQSLTFGNGQTGAVTLGGTGVLTLNGLLSYNSATFSSGAVAGLTTSTTLRTGIYVQSGSGATTISAPITLGNAQQWVNNSANTLLIQTGALTNGANTLTVGGTGNTTISSTFTGSGAGGVTKVGAGTLTLSGPNTYTGATNINAGQVTISNATSLGTTAGNTIVASGGRLVMATASLSIAEALNLTGTGTTATNGVLNFGGSVSGMAVTGAITLGGAARIQGDGSTGATLSGGINLGANALTYNADGGAIHTVNTAAITGAGGSLVKSGGGTLNLNFANSYDGGTSITGGILSFANDALGTTGNITVNGGTLRWGTGNTQNISSRLILQNSGNATFDTNSNAVSLGAFGSSASSSVTKVGLGTLTLSGINTFTSGVTISAGTLLLGSTGALNSTVSSENAVAFGAATTGTLALAGNSVVIANLTGSAVGPVVENNLAGTATLTVGNSVGSSGTYAGVLQNGAAGTLALTKAGSGTLALSGINTYSGNTTILAGTLTLTNSAAAGTETINLGNATLNNSATLGMTTAGTNVANALNVVVNTSALKTLTNAGTNNTVIYSGNITANDDLTIVGAGSGMFITGANNTIASTKTVSFSGTGTSANALQNSATWSGQGNISYTSNNNVGFIIQTGNNIYSGGTTLGAMTGAGGVEVRTNSTGPANAPTGGAFGTGTLSIGDTKMRAGNTIAGDITIGNAITFSNNPTFTTAASENSLIFTGDASLGAARTLTVETGSTVAGKAVEFSGVISGPGFGITKLGAGTLRLSGTNNSTGGTTISAGTLVMANTQALGTIAGNNIIGGGGTLDIATAGSDTAYNFTIGSGNIGTIISNVASGTTGINHTMGSMNIGGSATAGLSQLNITAGTGLTGTPTITFSGLNMSSGTNSVISTLNPTTAGLIVGTVTASNGTNKVLNLDGTNTGNQITGTISSGTGVSITKTNTSTWTLSGNNTYGGSTGVSNGTLIISGNNTTTGTISVSSNTGATLTLSGDNSGMTSNVTLNSSTGTSSSSPRLNINSATALGSGILNLAGVAAADVVRLDNTSEGTVNVSTANLITLNRNFTFIGTQSLNLGNGTATLGGMNPGVSRSIVVTANTLTLGGVVTETTPGTSNFGITLGGNGTLALTNAANTFSGKTVIGNNTGSSLRLQVSKLADLSVASSLGAPTTGALGLIQIGSNSNSSTLELVGGTSASTTNRQIQIGNSAGGSGGSTILNNNTDAAHTLTFSNTAFNVASTGVTSSFNRSLILGGSNIGDNTISGAIIANTGGTITSLSKTNSGTWVLNGTNTFTGAVSVADGILKVNSIKDSGTNSAVGAGSLIALGTGSTTGTLAYTGAGDSANRQIRVGSITVGDTGGGVINNDGTGALIFTAAAFNSPAAGVTVTRNLTIGGAYTSAINVIQGVIANNDTGTGGIVSITKAGAGTWALNGVNTYTGGTNINAGALQINNADALGTSGMIAFGGGTLKHGTGITTDLSSRFSTAASQAYNIDTNGNNVTLATDLASSGGTLAKSGAGTLELTGTHSYNGATTVSAGVLAVNGTLASVSTTVSGTGSTLKGNGAIAGTVTIGNLGTLASGNSIESLATGALSYTTGSNFQYELDKDAGAGAAGDLTAVTGNLSLTGTVNLSFLETGAGAWELGSPLGDHFGVTPADKLTLISYSGTWNGGLFTWAGNLVPDDSAIVINGQQWWFNYNDTDAGTNFTGDLTGSNFVTMTIPEPNVAALLGGLGVLALLRRRRH